MFLIIYWVLADELAPILYLEFLKVSDKLGQKA